MSTISSDRPARTPWAGALLLVLALHGWPAAASAQETRAGIIEERIEEKASQLQPYQPGKIERAMIFVEENNILRRLSARPEGWYPRLGGLTTGSGFAVGPGYRNYIGRDGVIDVSAAASLKAYRGIDVVARSTSFAGRSLALEARGRYQFFPQERYFGLGIDSRQEDRVSYRFENVGAAGGLVLWPTSPVRGAVRAGYASSTIGSGSGRFPSIETTFTPETAPALRAHPDYVTAQAELEVDYRDFPGNPRAGGHHVVSFTRFDDIDSTGFAFRRVDVSLVQLFPFFDKRRVIAVRAAGAFTSTSDGNEVPFYYMPFVGGPETLRGYRERRFTDRNLILLNAEYRYEVFAALDLALFVDAATVAARAEDLSLGTMKTDYGIGFRFGTRANLIMRFDIGLGGEGTRYFLKFGPVF